MAFRACAGRVAVRPCDGGPAFGARAGRVAFRVPASWVVFRARASRVSFEALSGRRARPFGRMRFARAGRRRACVLRPRFARRSAVDRRASIGCVFDPFL